LSLHEREVFLLYELAEWEEDVWEADDKVLPESGALLESVDSEAGDGVAGGKERVENAQRMQRDYWRAIDNEADTHNIHSTL